MAASVAVDLPVVDVPELEIGDAHDLSETIAAYGGWMTDFALARRLVCAADLASPSRRFLVGRVDGRPVGCALVWFAARTAYLSGVGMVPEARRRGYGRALTSAAARVGAHGDASARRPDLVWMHATDDGATVYSGMGFRRVDLHVRLGPDPVNASGATSA